MTFLTFPDLGEKEGVQFSEPQESNVHISFSRQVSDSSQLKVPVYVYNCSLEHLKEQLVHPNSSRQPRDIFFRYCEKQRQGPNIEKKRKKKILDFDTFNTVRNS